MGFFDFFRSKPAQDNTARPAASESAADWIDLADPRLAAFLRDGDPGMGRSASADHALRNTAVLRCVDIIASTIGSLPFYLMRRDAEGRVEHAVEHPLYDLLLHKPNNFQTGQQFRSHMQTNALLHGDGFALIVRSTRRVIQIVPLDPRLVVVRQEADWSLIYRYHKPGGGWMDYPASDILHIRGLSRDGILGISRTSVAREAINLALQAERAASRLFVNGVMGGPVLSHPKNLSQDAQTRLSQSFYDRHVGVDNAHRPLIIEEGMTYTPPPSTGANSQNLEQRSLQIEEIARVFGVPRPLLMQDSTSWGTGIEQLAILFVRFGLAPWFGAWEGAVNTTLLSAPERRTLYADFDERELLRGSMADQASYYSAALGAGGHSPWATPNEIRDLSGLGAHPDGDSLTNPMTAPASTSQAPPASTTGPADAP